MNTNFFEAFISPLKEPRGINKLLVGGLIIIFSGLLMVNWGEIFKFGKDYEYIFSILGLIGICLQFIPLGYCVKSAHECIQDEFLIMSEWKDLGDYFARGLVSAFILFLYGLPFYILLTLGIFSVLMLGANPLLIYPLLFLILCVEIMFISTVLMFYFKDLKFSDAFRIQAISKVFSKNLKSMFLILLNLIGLSLLSTIVSALVGITIIGLLLLPSLSILGTLAAFYIIAKEGREILWNENMWGVDEE